MWLLSFDASARDLTVALKCGEREFSRVLSPQSPPVPLEASPPGSPQGTPPGSSPLSAQASALTKKAKQASRQESVSLLIPTIDELLCEAKIQKSDLGALVVGIGPGGFTGVRVAVVTARTLSQIMKLPLVSINSLETTALESFIERPALQSVVVLKSASKTHLYLGVYERVLSSENVSISDLKPVQIPTYLPLQEGLNAAKQALLPGVLLRVDESLAHYFAEQGGACDSAVVKNIALTQAKLGDLRLSLFGIDPYLGYESCQPLYLRGASVTLKSGNAIERIESH